ncbi:uncharacterized protein LOC126676949 [Mercurialis annua]|uniref:uncharacterized protein LOC126676949 n=1 Tax=Mercurialis annua TaxID=3986 RepID=UPI00215E40DE|nr:uncharacterized protein LOC126676949 [Mercurialis annua]
MEIFSRAKNCFAFRLKSLTTLQRLNHLLIENYLLLYPRMASTDSKTHQCSRIDMSKWKTIKANLAGVNRSMIHSSAWVVLSILHDKGFEAYLVGGCVRDLLLKRIPKDFDIITTASLRQVKKQFHRCEIVGRRFPICRVHVKGSTVEVSSFKTVAENSKEKGKALLSQIPSGCDEKDFIRWRDSMHRDFTINSLFFDPSMNKIYDYANGMADLSSLKLRTIIPAHLSFQEDCARILRGLRIAGRLGLSISKETEIAIHKLSSSINSLDKARIMMELNYMLSYGAAESTICLLRRFNLFELFLPYHAAYLNRQGSETSSQDPRMLMKLFSNLDRLVSCDRPCNSILWVGLLAFHQALVTNPQDALVIRVLASVLYHGKWKEGVEFAKANAQVPVKFAPEISGFSESKSDQELAEEVSRLALLIQDSIGSFVNTDILAQFMSGYGVPFNSNLVFVSNKMGNDVAQIFDVLVHDVSSYKTLRKSFKIDYSLLGKGHHHETRFVLGKVILETLSGHTRVKVSEEGSKVVAEKHDEKLSDLVKDHIVESKDKTPIISQFIYEHEKKTGKKRKLVKTKCISGQEEAEEQLCTSPMNVLERKKQHVHGKSRNINISNKCITGREEAEGQLSMSLTNVFEKKRQHVHEKSRNINISDKGISLREEDEGQLSISRQDEAGGQLIISRRDEAEGQLSFSRRDEAEGQLSMSPMNELKKKKQPLEGKSRNVKLRIEEKAKHQEEKDCHVICQEVVKEKTENLKQTSVKEKSGRASLYNIFKG